MFIRMVIDMKRLLVFLLVLVSVTGFAVEQRGPYDPGAARKNLSNVTDVVSLDLSQRLRAAWAEITGNIYASGSARLEAGTAAAPAYSFSSDPDTGIYSPGADTIGFSAAGSQVATISSIGVTAPNITDLMGYTGYMPANVYGVEIDLSTPTVPVFTRLAGAVGKTPGADFNGINAFNRRRCNLSDAGVVNKYYGEAGYVEEIGRAHV